MVVVLDLDNGRDADIFDRPAHLDGEAGRYAFSKLPIRSGKMDNILTSSGGSSLKGKSKVPRNDASHTPENPNLGNLLLQALACYPITSQIGRDLDLISLHALAQTSRQTRITLLGFRKMLIKNSVRCSNERSISRVVYPWEDTKAPRATVPASPYVRYSQPQDVWVAFSHNVESSPSRWPLRKSLSCARDLVGDCRRCGKVVCRNCIWKPPARTTLQHRHRRLCSVCANAPLSSHPDHVRASTPLVSAPYSPPLQLSPPQTPTLAAARPIPAVTVIKYPGDVTPPRNPLSECSNCDYHVTYDLTITREPCSCAEATYLCQPCGRTIPNADSSYKQVWLWRKRYSSDLGGLGTGIGEGNEGVICARGTQCLAAEDKEYEKDCATSETELLDDAGFPNFNTTRALGSHGRDTGPYSLASPPPLPVVNNGASIASGRGVRIDPEGGEVSWSTSGQQKAGYLRQEIEGIGGTVKGKYKMRVKLGRVVREFEDEREGGDFLLREIRGERRSWCSWCDRVIMGQKDMGLVGRAG
ncbi:hypothetical protein MMC25_002347 [Agyrium rufum]|nr:hypothetical protein [Agyrium rufum]